jgi:hypothetical protein
MALSSAAYGDGTRPAAGDDPAGQAMQGTGLEPWARMGSAMLAGRAVGNLLGGGGGLLGAYRAMAVLLPRTAQRKLQRAIADGTRSPTEIADFVQLPDFYVEIWLQIGEEAERHLCGIK